ncbi:MAG: VCBS repeat-containing protein [Rhizobiaceae bacterium]
MVDWRILALTLTWMLVVPATAPATATAAEWRAERSSGFKSPGQGRRANGGLPDGYVASALRGDVEKAWFIQPTRRYRHAILGDDIEAGGLKVSLRNGKSVELTLPKNLVFEDRTPRLRDLDGDGKNEIITLLSSNTKGAAIAVYGLVQDKLKLVARTPFIGRSNRWRNIAGIADYNGDGAVEIAEVVTPHIGGTLKFWTWRNRQLKLAGSMRSFSNHAIGAREQRLSATADFNGDGRPDIAVPGASRRSLHLIGFVGPNRKAAKLQEIARIDFPSSISHPILATNRADKVKLKLKLSNGSVWQVRR